MSNTTITGYEQITNKFNIRSIFLIIELALVTGSAATFLYVSILSITHG